MQRIYSELEKLESIGQKRNLPLIEKKIDGKLIIDNTEYLNFASNDYLGLSTKLELKEEFLNKNNSLMSSASARLLTGSSKEFIELEATLCRLFNKEACLVFNTGYQCNLGVLSSLTQKGDVIFSDKLNHASIIDGMRLAEGDFLRYKHLDYENLENLLKTKRNKYNRAIIVSESVFSMDGDVANIDKLIELKNKYNCLLMIDEAHSFGTYGQNFVGLSYNKDVDIITATFGKALASFGAFCVANKPIINYLINKARSFIFSTSIPPINIAWTNWLLTEKFQLLEEQKNKLTNIAIEANKLFNTNNNTHIIPVIIGSNDDTTKITEILKSKGFYIPAIRPPTVPEGTSRLRISLTSDAKIEDLEHIIKIIHES